MEEVKEEEEEEEEGQKVEVGKEKGVHPVGEEEEDILVRTSL